MCHYVRVRPIVMSLSVPWHTFVRITQIAAFLLFSRWARAVPAAATPTGLDGGFLTLVRQRLHALRCLLTASSSNGPSSVASLPPPPSLPALLTDAPVPAPVPAREADDRARWVAALHRVDRKLVAAGRSSSHLRSSLSVSAQWAIQSLFPLLATGGNSVRMQVIGILDSLISELPLLALEREPVAIMDRLQQMLLSSLHQVRDNVTDLRQLERVIAASCTLALQRGSLVALADTCATIVPLLAGAAAVPFSVKLPLLDLIEELAGVAHDGVMDYMGLWASAKLDSFVHEWYSLNVSIISCFCR
jgi:hypothetical protein